MSTADTINSIRTHLTADYESLENIGAELENVDKNIENIASVVNGIYDNLPKTTGEGSSLSLNTLKGKMNIIPKGDTQQTQYSGINLFQAKLVTTTDNGITVTNNNNGTFTINGTNTSSSLTTFRLDQSTQNGVDNLQNYEDGTYTLDLGIQNENIQITLMQVNTWQQFIATGMNVRLKSGAITGATGMFIYIAIKGSATINNVVIKPMFVKGSYTTSTIPSFEPYVGGTASPNPTYPQDIEVVTGTQDVKVENVNLCKNAIVNATSGAYVDILYVDMDLKPNTTYTISFIGATNNKIYLNENITTPQYITCTGSRQSLTFTTKSTLDKTNTSQYQTSANGWIIFKNNSSNTETPSFTDVQIEKGSTATTYTPHQEQTQIVSLGDIELCKIGNYQDYLYKSNGKWYKKEYISKVVLNGSENWVTRSGGTSYAYAVTNFLPQNASNGLCNYWKFIVGGAGGSQANECIASANTTTALNIFTNNTNLNSVANLKTWLGTNTPIVYFNREVANDIEITNETLIEQLDNLEKLKSYNSTTNISSSGSLPMILNVSALKGE